MRVIAIDPGYEQSAVVIIDDGNVCHHETLPNDELLRQLKNSGIFWSGITGTLVIEQIESFGMPVGKEIFETVFWSGRFAQCWGRPFERLPRREVKLHLCGQSRAKDAHIRQALLDRFGPGREKAIGTKLARGPLYGVAGDQWAALAVAVTWFDQQQSHTNDGSTTKAHELGGGR